MSLQEGAVVRAALIDTLGNDELKVDDQMLVNDLVVESIDLVDFAFQLERQLADQLGRPIPPQFDHMAPSQLALHLGSLTVGELSGLLAGAA